MAKVSTTVVSSIAAPRKPFYAWLVPLVFYNQLETVLRDAAFLPGRRPDVGYDRPLGRGRVDPHRPSDGREHLS